MTNDGRPQPPLPEAVGARGVGVRQGPGLPGPWPSPPTGVAQLGYLLLTIAGGVLALAGAVYGVLVLAIGTLAADGVLALTALAIGLLTATQSLRALNPRRWRPLVLPPGWAWFGLMLVVWGMGIVVGQRWPKVAHRTLPPLILAGSALCSLFFLAATLRGLHAPAERTPLVGAMLPRHVILLAASVSAGLSTTMALLLEGALLALVLGVLLAMTRWLGDDVTLDLVRGIAQDPNALARLEGLIVQSPAALASLACVVVLAAPAIEELLKAIPLLLFARRSALLTERVAILIGVAGGVGFAFAENAGYLSMLADEWWIVFWLRAAAAVMHGVSSGYVGRAWYQAVDRGRWGATLLDLLVGWGIHAAWNGLSLLAGWFAYRGQVAGVLFCVLGGLVPLSLLFALLARWGIWVRDR